MQDYTTRIIDETAINFRFLSERYTYTRLTSVVYALCVITPFVFVANGKRSNAAALLAIMIVSFEKYTRLRRAQNHDY